MRSREWNTACARLLWANRGLLQETCRYGESNEKDREQWEVKKNCWDGFAPASMWYPSWVRESCDVLLVISCMLRITKNRHVSQSSTTGGDILRPFLLIFIMDWVSRKRNPKLNTQEVELIFVNNFFLPVLRINWMSCPWTLLIWDTEILFHSIRLGKESTSCISASQ